MPDWCNNFLDVQGEVEEVQRFREKAIGHDPRDPVPTDKEPCLLNFHSLVPIPDEVLRQEYHLAGIQWECQNWGCKWGACEVILVNNSGNALYYAFETPWGPPLALLKQLGVMWPGLKFLLEYDNEPGTESSILKHLFGWEIPEITPGSRFKGRCTVHGDHFNDQYEQF